MSIVRTCLHKQAVVLHQIRLLRIVASAIKQRTLHLQSRSLTAATQRWFRGELGKSATPAIIRHRLICAKTTSSIVVNRTTQPPVWLGRVGPQPYLQPIHVSDTKLVGLRHMTAALMHPESWLRRRSTILTLSRGPMARKKKSRQQYEFFKHATIRRLQLVQVSRIDYSFKYDSFLQTLRMLIDALSAHDVIHIAVLFLTWKTLAYKFGQGSYCNNIYNSATIRLTRQLLSGGATLSGGIIRRGIQLP